MLLALWSPKGGSGTSVTAAACAVVLARATATRLADPAGDQPALLGLGADPPTGLGDWLLAGPEAPAEGIERIAVPAAPNLEVLPAGSADASAAPPEAGAALGLLLREAPEPTVADLGAAATPALVAVAEVADASVLVMRGCYLALRRAVRVPLTRSAAGVALVEEPGRSLGAREVSDVLGLPVLARIPLRSAVARAVDAGVLAARAPDALVRPVRELLDHVGLSGHAGRAA